MIIAELLIDFRFGLTGFLSVLPLFRIPYGVHAEGCEDEYAEPHDLFDESISVDVHQWCMRWRNRRRTRCACGAWCRLHRWR